MRDENPVQKKQAVNPFLPSWEYIPDGEPYLFNGRVYHYGSHDRFNGYTYCLNDYVCWSAPEEDLSDWRYEGVIYERTDDPRNLDGDMCLYAPDVAVGPDGRYYLFYVLSRLGIVSVAVCNHPAGKYEFLGYVHHSDGSILGEREGDMPQFDPGVLAEGDRIYMYTGFCMPEDRSRQGPTVTVLGPDMLTVIEEPRTIVPSAPYSTGTSFEGHSFFEAPSIRKIGDTYYFIYSSILYSELCYATSKSPVEGFTFRGTIVANNDFNIDTYKPAVRPMFYGGNNHGSIIQIKGRWYVFYHRHTNGTNYSRQACCEPIEVLPDGSIPQAEMTSCGLNKGPLTGFGEYPAYIACNLFCDTENAYTGDPGSWLDSRFPKITQEGRDGDANAGYIDNMRSGATAGFKYFDCKGIRKIKVTVRGGWGGVFEVGTSWDGAPTGVIPLGSNTEWKTYGADIILPDGVHALYFRYRGESVVSLKSFTLE
ncbi:MAG: family 43 glycosylhydrolase [Oscillospiraceae bacterium]|nr:family 43 glycosylhydrolase [Oscillospiraceae bacterium]